MNLDRTKAAAGSFVRSQFPRDLYKAVWAGKVVAQQGPNSFDFEPDDPRIPGHSGIPVKLPLPGFSFQLDTGASPRANLGWANGDPTRPEIRLWEAPGLQQLTVQVEQLLTLIASTAKIQAGHVSVGAAPVEFPMMMSTPYLTAEAALFTALSTAISGAGSALTSAGGQTSFALAKPFLVTAGGDLTAAVAAFTAFNALRATFQSLIAFNS